jgi:hypothetical protein
MKFPYIPADIVVDEAIAEMRQYYRQGQVSKDDAYNNLIEAAKLVAGNNYDEATFVVPVKGHMGKLPDLFYTARSVFEAEECFPAPATVLESFKCSVTGRTYRKCGFLWPGDSKTTTYLEQGARNPVVPANTRSYWFKIPPGMVRTSFQTGLVGIHANMLPTDERGVVLVQDEPHNLIGLKNYIMWKMLRELYIALQIPQNVYNTIKDEALVFIEQAQAIQKFVDPSHMDSEAYKNNHRYDQFNLR